MQHHVLYLASALSITAFKQPILWSVSDACHWWLLATRPLWICFFFAAVHSRIVPSLQSKSYQNGNQKWKPTESFQNKAQCSGFWLWSTSFKRTSRTQSKKSSPDRWDPEVIWHYIGHYSISMSSPTERRGSDWNYKCFQSVKLVYHMD